MTAAPSRTIRAMDAEDLVQESFMKLHAQFDTVREPRRWLYRTVHNLAVNVHRQAARTTPLPNPPIVRPLR